MPMMRMPFTRKFPNKSDQPAGENSQAQNENTEENTNVKSAQEENIDKEQNQGENVEQKNSNPVGEGEDKGGKKVK